MVIAKSKAPARVITSTQIPSRTTTQIVEPKKPVLSAHQLHVLHLANQHPTSKPAPKRVVKPAATSRATQYKPVARPTPKPVVRARVLNRPVAM